VMYCTHSWLGMAGSSSKYFAAQHKIIMS
jgi:hypothetical protein